MELKIADALLTSKDLRPNQHKSLREISERGANAVVVWYCRGNETAYVTPYSHVDPS